MRKGMSLPLRIIVVLIVLLIAAFIVLMTFYGGIENIQTEITKFFGWMDNQKLPDTDNLLNPDGTLGTGSGSPSSGGTGNTQGGSRPPLDFGEVLVDIR